VLREEVHTLLEELQSILTEACRRFPVQVIPGDDNLVKPEKFLLSSTNGVSQPVYCMLTLMGDSVCEAELSLRLHKPQAVAFRSNIYPDVPWKVQQIQDAGNHLTEALHLIENRDSLTFQTGEQVIKLLDNIIDSLWRGRRCLALPRKKTLEELIKNHSLKAFKPALPNDTVLSFYIQAQRLVLAVYHLYVNTAQKIDISSRHQVECQVPWLNDILVYFTIALQMCQQLRDKLVVFDQYEKDTKVCLTKQSVTESAPTVFVEDLLQLQ